MDHGNTLVVAIEHIGLLMLAVVGMFHQLLDAHMDTDWFLVCMESSERNRVVVIDTQPPHFQLWIALKTIQCPKMYEFEMYELCNSFRSLNLLNLLVNNQSILVQLLYMETDPKTCNDLQAERFLCLQNLLAGR